MASNFSVKVTVRVPKISFNRIQDPLSVIGNRFVDRIKRNIRLMMKYTGGSYKFQAQSTFNRKLRDNDTDSENMKTVLKRSGLMHDSINWWLQKIQNRWQLIIGVNAKTYPGRNKTTIDVANIHQNIGVPRASGTPAQEKKLSRSERGKGAKSNVIRKFFGIAEKDRQWAERFINRWAVNNIRKGQAKQSTVTWRF